MGVFMRAAGFESKQVLDLPIAAISPNPGQPRTNFSPAALEELAQSIAVHGILQPLTVRRSGGGWQLVSGERWLTWTRRNPPSWRWLKISSGGT